MFDSMTSSNLYPKKTEAVDEIDDFDLDLENYRIKCVLVLRTTVCNLIIYFYFFFKC